MQVCDLGDLDCICEASVATISTDEFCTKSLDVETAFIFRSFYTTSIKLSKCCFAHTVGLRIRIPGPHPGRGMP